MADDPGPLRGGGRFTITARDDPPRVVKRGDPAALRREAAALRRVAGLDVAPVLVAHRHGELVTGRLPGAPRPLPELRTAEARRLGTLLRRLHDAAPAASGGLPGRRAHSLSGYARLRVDDLAPVPADLRALRDRVVRAFAPVLPDDTAPFRLCHGDLTAGNIVWTPRPMLVDWEFWRRGDPAEDLAYLLTVNAPGPAVAAAVIAGYGDPDMAVRAERWGAMCALDAGLWYLRTGRRGEARRLLAVARRLSGPRRS